LPVGRINRDDAKLRQRISRAEWRFAFYLWDLLPWVRKPASKSPKQALLTASNVILTAVQREDIRVRPRRMRSSRKTSSIGAKT
jgi:hypothetical protein